MHSRSPARASDKTPCDEKLCFLSKAEAYPGQSEPVERRETHMSWIFFAGDRVYKLKKAVRLPYLDFSTVERRRAMCEAELRLNRRLAPDVYLAVVPLTRSAQGLAIGGEGEAVDWLVVTRRLDESRTLESRLHNHVTGAELDRLADALTAFYRRARPVRMAPARRMAEWRKALAVNRQALLAGPPPGAPRGLVRHLDMQLRRFLARRGALLLKRERQGRIRDVHGDLRPEHIWICRPIRIIDCLEFSAELRGLDPLEEIAFLDLECARLGAPECGRRLRRRLVSALNERGVGDLYSFYRCNRAMLRARLSFAHLAEPNVRTPEKWLPLTRRYLEAALPDARAIARALSRPKAR